MTGLDRIGVGNNAIRLTVTRVDGSSETIDTNLRIDSDQELTYLRNGGILPYVVRKTVAATNAAA